MIVAVLDEAGGELTADDPAYVIEQEDGTVVLKLASEVERA